MPRVGAKIIILIFFLVLYELAWQGQVGKALACIISPGSLEAKGAGKVDVYGDPTQGADPSQPLYR